MIDDLMMKLLPSLPHKLVGRVAKRYIAGEDQTSAIDLAIKLKEKGFFATLDLLGEDVSTKDQANSKTLALSSLMESMATRDIDRNISIKLTQLGLRIDRSMAFDNLRRILETASKNDFFIRIDMEDSSVTDITLEFYRKATELWPRVGTVLQARLKRSRLDAEQLAKEGSNIRVCKGIYLEPEAISFQDPEQINESFMDVLGNLLNGDGYTAIATHDIPLIKRIKSEFAGALAMEDKTEFQALLGVPIGKTSAKLRDDGHRVRLYLPFGKDWYAYSLRRLKENPKIARYVMKDLVSKNSEIIR